MIAPGELASWRQQFQRPGLALLQRIGGPRVSPGAERLLLAIALQESACVHRYQVLGNARAGPARGWWQFERGGGVAGVMAHARTKALARALTDHLAVRWQADAVWRAIEGNDVLAAGFARLLLWSDPRALPTTRASGWTCYQRNWRPGKPHPAVWPDHWAAATAEVFREPAVVPA